MDDTQTARAIRELKVSLDGKHHQNNEVLETLNRKLNEVLAGFPEGDPLSHRKYHEALIKRAEAKTLMYQQITGDILTKGLWLALLGIAAILGKYFLQWVKGN